MALYNLRTTGHSNGLYWIIIQYSPFECPVVLKGLYDRNLRLGHNPDLTGTGGVAE